MLLSWVPIAVFFLALGAFFTCTETAILCSPSPSDRRRDERVTAAILIGDTFSNVAIAAITTAMLERMRVPAASLVATVPLTMLVLLFAELLPREVGRRRPMRWLQWVRRPMDLLVSLFSPAASLLNRVSRMMLLLVGLDPHELHPKVGSEDLRFLFKTGVRSGAGRGPLSLPEVTVREVMVPLTEVKALRASARAHDALEAARSTGFTRFPVYGSRIDEVLGVVNVYDIVYSDSDPEEPIKRFMRPGLYVPNTVAIDKLLFQMQGRKTPMAIVVDEFGGADGIVTVDDVVEEVIGVFEGRPPQSERPIQRQSEDVWLLDGHVPLDQLNEELGLELPKKNYETLAGFLMTEMEKIPEEGDRFKFENLVFTVSKAKRHTIQKVQLRIKR